jgi:P-type Cu+ transporter
MRVPEAIGIARRCRRIIVQNFAGTIAVDAAGMALAAAGFLHLVPAAIVGAVAHPQLRAPTAVGTAFR